MNAIVINTMTGAVTEYTRFGFQSITPTHAGSASGLYLLGGDTDAGLPIVSEIRTPKTLKASTLKKRLEMVYFSMRGQGHYQCEVFGATASWRYPFQSRAPGETRCQVGRGIRENYLGFGFKNHSGAAFELDRIEVLLTESKSRRV